MRPSPYSFSILAYRLHNAGQVWRPDLGQRYIQGALIEQKPFLEHIVRSAFNSTTVSQTSDLHIAYQGRVLSEYTGYTSRYDISDSQSLKGSDEGHVQIVLSLEERTHSRNNRYRNEHV